MSTNAEFVGDDNMNSSSSMKTLPDMVKDITFFFIKHHYDKILKESNKTKLEAIEIENFINKMYTEKEKTLKQYIKDSLKETLKEQYPKMQVNMLILEMFEDPDFAKKRVYNEIISYQDNL